MKKALQNACRLLAVLLGAHCVRACDISYWISPCNNPATRCKEGDEDLAKWALEAWERVSDGKLHFSAAEPREAKFLMVWALPARGVYGETVPIEINGKMRERMDLRVEDGFTKDRLLHDTIVYLTCVHESGHALGLPHTSNFDDIMYSFQYGGDITEYFARFRRKLTNRDDIRKYSGISSSDRARLLDRLKSEAH